MLDAEELREPHGSTRDLGVVKHRRQVAGLHLLLHVDGRLEALDKSLQANQETRCAAALARDRTLEVQILGQDLAQPFLVERGDPVLPAAVVGADERRRLGHCGSHVLLLHVARVFQAM